MDSLATRSTSRARSALICSLTVSPVSALQFLHDADAAPAAKLSHAQAARPIKSDVNAFAMAMNLAEVARRRQPIDARLAHEGDISHFRGGLDGAKVERSLNGPCLWTYW